LLSTIIAPNEEDVAGGNIADLIISDESNILLFKLVILLSKILLVLLVSIIKVFKSLAVDIKSVSC